MPTHINQATFEAFPGGEYQITTTGSDGYIEFALPPVDQPKSQPVLGFEYFSPTGVQSIEVRLRRKRGAWEGPIDAGSLLVAEGWTEASLPMSEVGRSLWDSEKAEILRIDFGQVSDVSLRLRNVRFRAYTSDELQLLEDAERRREIKLDLAKRIRGYLDVRQFGSAITEVVVQRDEVTLKGELPEKIRDSSNQVRLVELRNGEPSIWDQAKLTSDAPIRSWDIKSDGDQFDFQIARFDGGIDRLLSRWQLVEIDDQNGVVSALSPMCYATDISALGDQELAAVQQLRNAKGLGGVSPVFGLEELIELGVKHITLNVVVTDLLFEHEVEGAPTFEYGGRRWWVREGRLRNTDQAAKFAAENGITAAAIILLPQKSKDILVHPESTSSGIYAMPNLGNREAAIKYEAVMHFLASRYSGAGEGSGAGQGRIDHWIMHNEVDFGWIWTNMGEQPLEVYMDSYVQSMRIAYLQAAKFNPHAKVFISLTHHWNVENDPRWRTYSPRHLLNHLAGLTKVEGDFGWGVAYHPYPQNLFNPKSWEDKQVSDSYDSRLITMKNLQVLERFLKQERFLNRSGKIRDVLLSEQGYHTDGYGEEAQRLQGAALLYTWDRLRATDFVLAYDYHRWVDAAEEGGLLLGLRTVGSPGKINGDKKLGWEVYRDIGTDAESKWRVELESIYK